LIRNPTDIHHVACGQKKADARLLPGVAQKDIIINHSSFIIIHSHPCFRASLPASTGPGRSI